MPCAFIFNWPVGVHVKASAVRNLNQEVAAAVGCEPKDFRLHISDTSFLVYNENGDVVKEGVHIWVEWHKRPFGAKEKVALALHKFIEAHNIPCNGGPESDITFCDRPHGTFFVNGELVGPEPDE